MLLAFFFANQKLFFQLGTLTQNTEKKRRTKINFYLRGGKKTFDFQNRILMKNIFELRHHKIAFQLLLCISTKSPVFIIVAVELSCQITSNFIHCYHFVKYFLPIYMSNIKPERWWRKKRVVCMHKACTLHGALFFFVHLVSKWKIYCRSKSMIGKYDFTGNWCDGKHEYNKRDFIEHFTAKLVHLCQMPSNSLPP